MVDGQVPCTLLIHTHVYAPTLTHTCTHACLHTHTHSRVTCDTHRIHAHKHMHTYYISSLSLSCIVYELLASIIMQPIMNYAAFAVCYMQHLALSTFSPISSQSSDGMTMGMLVYACLCLCTGIAQNKLICGCMPV